MDGYAGLGIMFVLAFAFPVFPLIVAPLLQPRQPTREKRQSLKRNRKLLTLFGSSRRLPDGPEWKSLTA